MDFIQQLQTWAKGDVLQGKIMLGAGVVLLISLIGIFRGESEVLRGSLIPLGLALVVLIGYGSYVIFSRQGHVQEISILYEKTPIEAIGLEINKQQKDYDSCKTLMKVYPLLMLIAVLGVIFLPSMHYKGMAMGFLLLFITAFLIDSNFASRSYPFLESLRILTQ